MVCRPLLETNANFTDEWYLAASIPNVIYYYLLIETMDNSNETGDFVQICFNGGMTADSAPSSTDFAINFTSKCSLYVVPRKWSRMDSNSYTFINQSSNGVNHLVLRLLIVHPI